MSHLPPLAALRAFESTARLNSVTRAAEELHLTHSAISHQLRALEDLIGVALFTRENKSMTLTPAGREYAYQIRQALAHIVQATARTARDGRTDVLRVAVLPSFATHWLIPRLNDWYAQYPHIQLILDASLDIIDFEQERADCAVRMGEVSRDGTKQFALMRDWQMMVAGINDARYSTEQTDDLAVQAGPLIGIPTTWMLWSKITQTALHDAYQPLIANDSNLGLAAAQQNMGLLLTRWSIAAHGVQNGTLKQVTHHMLTYENGYQFAYPDRSAQEPKVKMFHEWLQAQCDIFEQYTEARIQFLQNSAPNR
jgi:LysR family glycine cleavage system transcriptional activator